MSQDRFPGIRVGQVYLDLDKRMPGRRLVVRERNEWFAVLGVTGQPGYRTRIHLARLDSPHLFRLVDDGEDYRPPPEAQDAAAGPTGGERSEGDG